MVLIPKELFVKIPKLYVTEYDPNPTVWIKLFYPDFSWTWYIIEYDGADLCFGYVEGFEKELGYFTLSELRATRGKLGCPIERDRYFEPRPLSAIRT